MAHSEASATSSTKGQWTGRLLVTTAAVLWSTSGLFAKAPIFDTWPESTRGLLLAFWRAAFAAMALIWLVRRVQWRWTLVPMTLVFALMNISYLSALVLVESSVAIWLQNTAPAWVFAVGVLLLGERYVRRDISMLILAACGMSIILFFQLRAADSTWGVLLGVLAGITFAGVVLFLRAHRDFDSAWLIFLNHLVTAILLAPAVVVLKTYPTGLQWVYLALFGILQMGIPYWLFARSVQYIAGHEASGLALLEPLLVPLWVFLVWRSHPGYEPPLVSTIIGGGLILAGLAIRYCRVRRLDPTESKGSDESS